MPPGWSIGLALDLHVFGLALPTVHRQVDEAWRTSYRGWVWGLGFGLELGTGVVTIVTSSTIYATWFAAFLSGDVVAGALVGVTFGLARSLPVLTVSRVRRPEQLPGSTAASRGWRVRPSGPRTPPAVRWRRSAWRGPRDGEIADRGLELTVPAGWEARIWVPDLPPPAINLPVSPCRTRSCRTPGPPTPRRSPTVWHARR